MGKYNRSKPYYSGMNKIERLRSQSLAFGDFTDGGATTGYIDFTSNLPAGAVPIASKITIITGFDGASVVTATAMVGVSGDTDRFSADTSMNVNAAGIVGSAVVAADAAKGISAAVTPRVTVTEDSDFGEFESGEMVVDIFYVRTA